MEVVEEDTVVWVDTIEVVDDEPPLTGFDCDCDCNCDCDWPLLLPPEEALVVVVVVVDTEPLVLDELLPLL